MRPSLLVRFAAMCLPALCGCPVDFQTQSAATLRPSAISHIVVIRQNDGSFTGYEMADSSPYQVLKIMPHFQNQLTTCPPSPKISNDAAVLASARLAWGGYLFLKDTTASVNVVELDASLNLVWESPLNLPAYPNPTSYSYTFADVNGDGLPDILAPTVTGTDYKFAAGINVFLGKGGTAFQPPVFYPIAGVYSISPLVVADLNGDHKLDLVVASFGFPDSPTKISMFAGNGDGTFQPEKVVMNTPYSGVADPLAVDDLNRDGKPDLVFTTSVSGLTALMVALGAGGGAFSTPVSYPITGNGGIAIGDVNEDGFPDIVTGGISIFFGDGTGAFPKRRDYLSTGGDIFLTDFNGDGKIDIVSGSGNPSIFSGTVIAVLYGRGNGIFDGAPVSIVPPLTTPHAAIVLESADIDGDGIPDLICGDVDNFTVFKGVGDGNFKQTWQFSTHPDGFADSIAIGDFNGDGRLDFAAGLAGLIEVFLGNGDGTFQSPLTLSLVGQPLPDGSFTFIAAADFNRDGKLDLAVARNQITPLSSIITSTILVFLGNGDGTFASPLSQLTSSGILSIASGDFNNDGIPDLAVTTDGSSSNFSLLLGKGDGTFKPGATVPLESAGSESGAYKILVADFNLDGKLDVAVTTGESDTGGFAVLLGGGDGTFQPPVSYAPKPNYWTVGDINGDCIPDLIIDGSVLLGKGDGSFQPEISIAGVRPVAVADFNRDGKTDIAGAYGLGVTVLLNTSPRPILAGAPRRVLGPERSTRRRCYQP